MLQIINIRKYIASFIAILIAIATVSLKEAPQKKIANKKSPIQFCFKFVGTKNSEEGDVTKWEQVTFEVCVALQCGRAHNGCKITTTATQTISGQVRPANVYLAPGTNDPVTGQDVTSVSNADN